MFNESCLFPLKVYARWKPPTMPIPTSPTHPEYSYFGTAGHVVGSWTLDEASSPEFDPDNICSNELALLPDTCCWLAISAASRRMRSCWYAISFCRSSCIRYSRSCCVHHTPQTYSNCKLHSTLPRILATSLKYQCTILQTATFAILVAEKITSTVPSYKLTIDWVAAIKISLIIYRQQFWTTIIKLTITGKTKIHCCGGR